MGVFLDTNILLYSVSVRPDEIEKRRTSNELLDRPDCILSVQVFQEFYAQATRPSRSDALNHPDAISLLQGWRRFQVVENSLALFDYAMEIREFTGYSIWDCSILAAAQASGCETLCSEDMAHGRAVGGVTIVNPFRPA
jgi:predicted nucleic acid-binding protein